MSNVIHLVPTVNGLQRAINTQSDGVALDVKYVAVGQGYQDIPLDDQSRTPVEQLKDQVGLLEVADAQEFDGGRWQISVDLLDIDKNDWALTEFALLDVNQQTIAIYGSATRALLVISDLLDHGFISIDMFLGAFPEGSINIVHNNLPINLFFDQDLREFHLALTDNMTRLIQAEQTIQQHHLSHLSVMAAFNAELTHQINDHARHVLGVTS